MTAEQILEAIIALQPKFRAHVANNPTNFAGNLGNLHLGLDNADFFI